MELQKTVVINIVGLSSNLIGDDTPFIQSWMERGVKKNIKPVLPAVTCTAQSTYLTGAYPEDHGIVANGWYFQQESEVKFWRQSNKLVEGTKIWEFARAVDPSFTCANMFWWYNMYSSVDYSVTPRPMYPADGRKIPDVYTYPGSLRSELQDELGTFPLFKFWGPKTSIESSEWIARASIRVEQAYNPTLTLIYLPHLDYNLQKVGPEHKEVEKDLREIDRVVEKLVDFYEKRGARVILLSEYGITPVDRAVSINRVLREAGFIRVREELGRELLDAGASEAFAVADHQIAHVYVKNKERIPEVKALLEATEGIELVLDEFSKEIHHIDHARAGDLVAVADHRSWFTYYYWLSDDKAPDFARTVDIHRKPGYDPVEMFIDPNILFPMAKVGWTLFLRKLGFRVLMDLTPLDPTLVKGSHGRVDIDEAYYPVFITRQPLRQEEEVISATDVFGLIMKHLKGDF